MPPGLDGALRSNSEPGMRQTLFMHIPKTAGTSVLVYMRQVFAEHPRLELRDQDGSLAKVTAGQVDAARFIWLHEPLHRFGFSNGSFFKFTFLRDPIERIFSLYNYLHNPKILSRQDFSSTPDSVVQALWRVGDMTLEDFVLSDDPVHQGYLDNAYAKYFASARGVTEAEIPIYNMEHKFDYVGFTDTLSTDLEAIRELCFPNAEPFRSIHVNRSEPAELKEALGARARARIARSVGLDLEIYEHARRMMQRRRDALEAIGRISDPSGAIGRQQRTGRPSHATSSRCPGGDMHDRSIAEREREKMTTEDGERIADPEERFRRWPAARRRWTRSILWRRLRLPVRRRRWLRQNRAACAPYRKATDPGARGVVVALGDFSGENGLSLAALRELARLRREHGEVEVIDCGPAHHGRIPVARHEGPPVGTLYLLSAPDTYARFLPALPSARVAAARRIGLWFWETPRLSADWDFAFDVVHEVWTFSDYSRRAVESAGHGIPVTVRPYPVPEPPTPAPAPPGGWRAAFGVPADAFLGIAVMDLRSCPARKNPWAHVAAWQTAFGDDPRCALILKFIVSKRTACVRDELREMVESATNVRLVEQYLEAGALAGLQAAADVYLSLHRAEGYGLVIREMLELGIPVVATDWSANAEYGPAYPHYHGVPWRLVPYRDWTGHYPGAAFSWAEADIAAAAGALRRVADASVKWRKNSGREANGS